MSRRRSALQDLKRRLDEKPEFRREYRRQSPFYDVLRAVIQRRHELGLTQEELARRAGTHQSRISRIENAEYDIQLSTLTDIAEALGVRVEISFAPIAEYEQPEKPLLEWLVQIPAPAKIEHQPTDYAPTSRERVLGTVP
jgi:transcriptional regulator with XRE-family HTH domain